jgi:hypothetical protein
VAAMQRLFFEKSKTRASVEIANRGQASDFTILTPIKANLVPSMENHKLENRKIGGLTPS